MGDFSCPLRLHSITTTRKRGTTILMAGLFQSTGAFTLTRAY
nr:MAG TPA: hypothetical protein [Caudoviricetes sp.]